jgi:hypothetical protein
MGRGWLVIAACGLLIALGYALGVLAESFSLNQCYALSIETLAEDADRTAASKSEVQLERFRALVRSLPLAGYKTSCRRVQAAIETVDFPAGGPRS